MRFKRWHDKLLNLFGKLLLIEALKEFDLRTTDLCNLYYDKNSRPCLSGAIDFNISHSGDYVVCAFAHGCRVGVDIEKIESINFDDFEQVMSQKEWAHIKSSEFQTETFFNYWTIKESVIKADSLGLSIPLNSIVVNNNSALCLGRTWYITEICIDKNYCAHIASSAQIIELQYIYKKF